MAAEAHHLFGSDLPAPIRSIRPVRVLFVGGTGQSGSTLLSRMIGRLPGFVALGEVGRIWDKGIQANLECGCGAPFRVCPFWARVGDVAFGGWSEIDAREATRLRDAVTLKDRRAPHAVALPLILHPVLPGVRSDLEAYAALLHRVYRAVHEITAGAILVDSMKLPGHGYLASTMTGLDVCIAHITRDPRGYAYSNTKWIERQGGPEGSHRVRRSPRKSAVKWSWCNLAYDELARRGTPTTRVRYEDLIRAPSETLGRVASMLDVHMADEACWFLREGEVELVRQHLVAGSRGRLRHGVTPLRMDDAWRTGLSINDVRTVQAITWPLRRRYGYHDASVS